MTYHSITPFIHIVHSPLDRKQVDIEIVLSAGGSYYEEPIDAGRKHLMEHCIATRTQDMDLIEFKNWQFRENIMINAYTSPTLLAVNSSSHKEQFPIAMKACCQMIFEPMFDQAVLDQEKEVVLREITERTGDPEYVVYYWTMDKTFSPNSVERYQTLGSMESVASTTVDDLVRLHKSNLSQSHIVINVTGGGIDFDYIVDMVQDYLKANNAELLDSSTKLAINNQPFNQILDFGFLPLVHPQAHAQASLTMFIPAPVSLDNEPTLKVFEELFLKYYGVLYHTLRDTKGYIYGLYSTFRKDIQMLEINMSCELEYIKPIVDTTKEIFGDFDQYFDLTKFQELKKILRLKIDLSSDSSSSRFSNSNLFQFGRFLSFEDYEKLLNSVKPQDVQDLYNSIASNLSKMQVVAVSKDDKIIDVVL